MTRYFYCLAACFLLVGHVAAAQTATLRGHVRDASSGEPLPGANVVLDGTTYGASTDLDGTFATAAPAGTYTLRATFIGYNPFEQTITLQEGQELVVDIALEEKLFQGEEIVVSGSLRPEKLTDTPATIGVITAADIQFIPTNNPGELLARQKGVDYFRAGIATPAINVRGFNSNFNSKNLQVTDGRYATLVATGLPFGPLDVVGAEDIERQEVVLGPNGALYGPNAHNGLINTITKDPRTSEGTVFNVRGGNQSQLAVGARHAQVVSPRLAYKVNLDYSRAEEFAFVDSVYIGGQGFDEYQLDRDTEFIKGSAAAYVTVAEDADVIVNYGGSNSTYLSPTNVGRNQIIDWQIHTMQARFVSPRVFAQVYHTRSITDDTYSIDQRTKNYWTAIGAGMSETEAETASLGNEARFIDHSRRWNAELQYRNTFATGYGALDVIAGGQYQLDKANSYGSYLLDQDEDDYINVWQRGVYGQVSADLPAGLRAVIAFRGDDHEIYGFNLLPKAALLYRADHGTFRLTYGKGIAAPTILNMYGKLFGGLILGNAEGFTLVDGTQVEKQKVEKLQTFEAGYKGQLVRSKLFLDANTYYSMSEDFLSPLTVLGVATHRGDTPIEEVQPLYGVYNGLVASYVNFGRFDTYGVDVGLTYMLTTDLSATLNYSYFDITYDENDLENNDFNGDGVVNEFDHLVNAPNHKGSLALNYNGPKFFGSVLGRYVQAYDYFSSYQIASETRPGQVYRGSPIVEDARSTDAWNYGPLAGEPTVDLGVGYKINPNVRASVQVTNLFDTEIREFTASPFVGRLISAGVRVEL